MFDKVKKLIKDLNDDAPDGITIDRYVGFGACVAASVFLFLSIFTAILASKSAKVGAGAPPTIEVSAA